MIKTIREVIEDIKNTYYLFTQDLANRLWKNVETSFSHILPLLKTGSNTEDIIIRFLAVLKKNNWNIDNINFRNVFLYNLIVVNKIELDPDKNLDESNINILADIFESLLLSEKTNLNDLLEDKELTEFNKRNETKYCDHNCSGCDFSGSDCPDESNNLQDQIKAPENKLTNAFENIEDIKDEIKQEIKKEIEINKELLKKQIIKQRIYTLIDIVKHDIETPETENSIEDTLNALDELKNYIDISIK